MHTARGAVVSARAGIENLAPAELAAELGRGVVVLVDVREPGETGAGIIDPAVRIPRGLLEFCAEPGGVHQHPALRPDRRIVLYSTAGFRSALATQTLQLLGYPDVAHLDGGVRAWVASGRSLRAVGPSVELLVPDQPAAFVRVMLTDRWVGDLLPRTELERNLLLAALRDGRATVVKRAVPLLDVSVAETEAPARR